MEMHELLVGARNVIDKQGHTQYVNLADDGSVCLYGAMTQVLTADANSDITAAQAKTFATALGFAMPVDAVQWNDTPGRTQDEVLARLDKAIAETAPAPEMGLKGPSRTIIVQPIEQPEREPEKLPEPAPTPEREPEPVPA